MVCILCFMLFYVFNVLLFSFILIFLFLSNAHFFVFRYFLIRNPRKSRKQRRRKQTHSMPCQPCHVPKPLKLQRNSLAEAVAVTGCDGYTEWKSRDDCFYISSKILQFTRKPKPEFNIRFKMK